uniref:ABC-2 type transporter n=1 Tax=Geobacillus sp. (strain Y4.1MC1) TaxID=581103 RepID=A0A7U3YGH4_GEOS0
MSGILIAKFRLFLRKPWLFVIMTTICILMAFLIGTANQSKINVPVYSHLSQKETNELFRSLRHSDLFDFQPTKPSEIRKLVSEGKVEAGVELEKNAFRLIVSSETANVNLIRQYVQKVYVDHMQAKAIIEHVPAQSHMRAEEVKKILNEAKTHPLFTFEKKSFHGEQPIMMDSQLQPIFGFSLFFVIYTVSFNVLQILVEKRERIWDRMILSPLKKWEIYASNLLYSFAVGYIQVALIFSIFHFGVGVDFHGKFAEILLLLVPYVFTLVALSIFITGLVKSEQQFRAIISIVSVSMAMIGGAYWPLEIVSSKILLTLSKFVPVTYGMELLKGSAVYGNSISDLLYPISVLFFMGVVLMGLGINLVERRNA